MKEATRCTSKNTMLTSHTEKGESWLRFVGKKTALSA